MDKKTGTAPGYIKGNHNMASYGEDDPADNNDDDNDKSLDDYRHKSTEDEWDELPNRNAKKKAAVIDDDDEPASTSSSISSNSGPVNYYYYTYQNSLNKNTDSFNKYRTDDHSTGKQINSNNSICIFIN